MNSLKNPLINTRVYIHSTQVEYVEHPLCNCLISPTSTLLGLIWSGCSGSEPCAQPQLRRYYLQWTSYLSGLRMQRLSTLMIPLWAFVVMLVGQSLTSIIVLQRDLLPILPQWFSFHGKNGRTLRTTGLQSGFRMLVQLYNDFGSKTISRLQH